MPEQTRTELVAIGVITAAHGIRGQVKIRSFTDIPEDLVGYGAITDKTGTRRFDIRLDGQTKAGLIATIRGITTCNAAESLKGTELYVRHDALPEPDEDEFYYESLIGLNVQTESGEAFGEVRAIRNYGASDLLEIRLISGKTELFAFTEANFPAIDVEAGNITIRPPEILEAPAKKGAQQDG